MKWRKSSSWSSTFPVAHVMVWVTDGTGALSLFPYVVLAVWWPGALNLITFLGFQTCLRGGGGRVEGSRRWWGHAGGRSCCQLGASGLLKSPVFLPARSDIWFPNPRLPAKPSNWQHTRTQTHTFNHAQPRKFLPALRLHLCHHFPKTEATFDTVIVVLSRRRRKAWLAPEGRCDATPLLFLFSFFFNLWSSPDKKRPGGFIAACHMHRVSSNLLKCWSPLRFPNSTFLNFSIRRYHSEMRIFTIAMQNVLPVKRRAKTWRHRYSFY